MDIRDELKHLDMKQKHLRRVKIPRSIQSKSFRLPNPPSLGVAQRRLKDFACFKDRF